jgi:multimeric flavodoxin WrbA
MGDDMKILAFNGSPRTGGNTELLIKEVFNTFKDKNIDPELIQIGGKLLHGCTGCRKCIENKNEKCIIDNDELNSWIGKIKEADVIILGSPVYFADITPEMKAFIDRIGYITRANGHLLKRKIGAAIVAVRRAGGLTAFDSINRFFLVNQMIVIGSSYWNVGIGRDIGDVLEDEEGMQTMKTLGENIYWALQNLK